MAIEFSAYPKTPRLFRDTVITEKIDGTNAAVGIATSKDGRYAEYGGVPYKALADGRMIYAQSRKRLITPEDDNFGFAAWVWDNAEALVETLGDGLHFGEWYGAGIQRGYGMTGKRFALFNVHRWGNVSLAMVPGLTVVPTLAIRTFSEAVIETCLAELREFGSQAVGSKPGFPAEGIVVYHTQSKQVYKVLLENDDKPKGAVA